VGRLLFPIEISVTQVVEKQVEVPSYRVVEKRVEVPVERIVEKKVQVPLEVVKYVDRIVEKRVEVPVERIVVVPITEGSSKTPRLPRPREGSGLVEVGMTKEQVVGLIGPSDSVSIESSGRVVYWYGSYGRRLIFSGNQLVEVRLY